MNPTLLVLCINYHSTPQTLQLADDLAGQQGVDWQLMVVDNSEQADACLGALNRRPRMSVQRPGSNLGYLGGAAWGLEEYLRHRPLPDWVMVANADLRLSDHQALAALDASELVGVGVVAPAIVSGYDGRDQNPYMTRRISRGKVRFLRILAGWYPLALAYFGLYRLKKRLWASQAAPQPRSPGPIYAPHGACMILSRRYFEAGGSLEYASFLFGEELFIAETARQLGLTVYYQPAVRLHHAEHVVTGWLRSRRMTAYQRQSLDYCYRRFFAKDSFNDS